MTPWMAPADWCSYRPSLKCRPMMVKSSPELGARGRRAPHTQARGWARRPPSAASGRAPRTAGRWPRGSEDVARAHEAGHRRLTDTTAASDDMAADALLGVELLAGTDRAKRHVVGDDHADGRLDLLLARALERAVHGSRRDRAVNDVVDLVRLQREYLGQAPADLVEADHRVEGGLAVETFLLRGRHYHRVEVVVAELAGLVAALRAVAEVGAVGVPLAHCRRVGQHRLLGRHAPPPPPISVAAEPGTAVYASASFRSTVGALVRRAMAEAPHRYESAKKSAVRSHTACDGDPFPATKSLAYFAMPSAWLVPRPRKTASDAVERPRASAAPAGRALDPLAAAIHARARWGQRRGERSDGRMRGAPPLARCGVGARAPPPFPLPPVRPRCCCVAARDSPSFPPRQRIR